NAGGKILGELHFHSEGVGFNGLESRMIILISCTTVTTRVGDGLPFAILAVKQLPRFRQPAFADTGIVKPVYLDAGHFSCFVEFVLHPFLATLVRPPMEVAIGMVARTRRLPLVIERPHVRPNAIVR